MKFDIGNLHEIYG